MKAVVIDAQARTITDKIIKAKPGEGALSELQACVGGYIERAGVNLGGDDLFVNEEGAINGTEVGFLLQGQVFAGNGVIVGHNGKGNTISAKTKANDLDGVIQFVQFTRR